MLFDVENDPYELTNLAGSPDYAEIESELAARLSRCIAETDDPFETADRDGKRGLMDIGWTYTSDRWEK